MTTLRQFSEKERDYHAYQARQNYLREQQCIQLDLDAARQEKLEALQAKEAAIQEKEAAIREKEAAIQEKAAAIQEKETAIAEIQRLKAILTNNS